MRIIKNGIKAIFFVMTLLSVSLFILIFVLNRTVSKSYRINKGNEFSLKSKIPFTAELLNGEEINTAAAVTGENYEVNLKIFGLIPFSTVNVEVVEEDSVCVLGQPFGMRIYTEGVLVVNTKNVVSDSGQVNPARIAGIKVGDYILSVDGVQIQTNEELSSLVVNSNGQKMRFEIMRNSQKLFVNVRPVIDRSDGQYHIGILVRDSTAGIGTLTFYSPTYGVICGLGHSLNDTDTGEIIKIDSGQMVSAEIISVKKGEKGSPGELVGKFENEVVSPLELNDKLGVYGKTELDISSANLTKVALKQEITNGNAQILCTVNGDTPRLYSCRVEIKSDKLFGGEKRLVVEVTDKNLLEKTGGIVQGMSGSPILQNGKLIGAVTHVLVDDPTKGYGIFAENMLETAGDLYSSQLKLAS